MTSQLFPDSPAFKLAGEQGRGRLLAALSQPRWRQYPTLQSKAATLHFHLNRDHPYIDGNKRLALVATELFLTINGAALVATDGELKDLALGVARGDLQANDNLQFVRRPTFRAGWDEERFAKWFDGLDGQGHNAIELFSSDGVEPQMGIRLRQLLLRQNSGD